MTQAMRKERKGNCWIRERLGKITSIQSYDRPWKV